MDPKQLIQETPTRGLVTNPQVVSNALGHSKRRTKKEPEASGKPSAPANVKENTKDSSANETPSKKGKNRKTPNNNNSNNNKNAQPTSGAAAQAQQPQKGNQKESQQGSQKDQPAAQADDTKTPKRNNKKKKDNLNKMLYPDMFDEKGNRVEQNNENDNHSKVAAPPLPPGGSYFSGNTFHSSPAPSSLPRPKFGGAANSAANSVSSSSSGSTASVTPQAPQHAAAPQGPLNTMSTSPYRDQFGRPMAFPHHMGYPTQLGPGPGPTHGPGYMVPSGYAPPQTVAPGFHAHYPAGPAGPGGFAGQSPPNSSMHNTLPGYAPGFGPGGHPMGPAPGAPGAGYDQWGQPVAFAPYANMHPFNGLGAMAQPQRAAVVSKTK